MRLGKNIGVLGFKKNFEGWGLKQKKILTDL
jgi:hypothetical protein